MKKVKLAIGIPTYNRSTYLEKLILQFEAQILNSNLDINIYISDNSDNDTTSQMISKIKNDYDNIYYSKNPVNVGFDKNVLNVVEQANSEYVWIFGDDDEIQENTLVTIIEYIERFPEVDYFLVNSLPCDPVNMETLGTPVVDTQRDTHFESSIKALEEISWYSTFVGAYVVKKSAWNSYDAEKYLNTLFVHVGKLFESVATKKSKIYFIAKPMIKYRTNNTTWINRLLEIQLVLWPKTINSLPEFYSDKSKLMAIKSVSNRFVTLGTLYNLKNSKLLNMVQFKKIIIPFIMQKKEFYRIKIGVYYVLLYICPLSLLTFLKKMKHLILKKSDV